MRKIALLLTIVRGALPALAAGTGGEPRPVVRYQEAGQLRDFAFELRDGAQVATNGDEWVLGVDSSAVQGLPDARDYRLTWTLSGGTASAAVAGVVFEFKDWSPGNFVLVPAAVYDGNRFDIKDMRWPSYWYNKSDWRLDMPTTMTARFGVGNPTLGKGPGPGRINLHTGCASLPLLAFQSPAEQRGWMVQTTQRSRLGNHRLNIEENAGRSVARFEIATPVADWKTGDAVTIPFRVYSFPAKERADLLRRFSEVRKDFNPSVRTEELPFSAAWTLLDNLYRDHRWDERHSYYRLSDPAAGYRGWFYIWQLGWCGGGQVTLPLLMRGDEPTRQRARRNLDMIFTKTQAASGFFNTVGNGDQFASFGIYENLKYHESLIRSQGDWLYMAQRQFQQIESDGGTVPAHWTSGLQKQADAFVRLWEKYGQFGQFVDVETGDLCIGGSTSGGIAPAGLALASTTFKSARYLEVAEAAARTYYRDFVTIGYTTGGPGEILSAPDSESAFGLFESFMALYEVTGSAEWLRYADALLPICASWIVAYDYQFPSNSPLGRIDAHSCGAVWASVPNKHAMPGICTWSGDSLLKYFRATGDARALELITDIAHGITQYVSRQDRRVGTMSPGSICERVNLSDWEGPQNVGGNIFGSCSWTETEVLLTVTQIPGLYVQPDTGVFAAFDNIRVEKLSHTGGTLRLRLINPTKFPADVTCLVETSRAARKPVANLLGKGTRVIHLDAGAIAEEGFYTKSQLHVTQSSL